VKNRSMFTDKSAKAITLALLVAWWVARFPVQLSARPASVLLSTNTFMSSGTSLDQDPNKPASELNHHLIGYALIAIGALVIVGQSSERLRPLQSVWPLLFVFAGLFLAAWSDGEIWPRGDLNWGWLVFHDAEARQHKIYAILLMGMGIVEYLRLRAKLSRFWLTWAFTLLAIIGVVLLLLHDHSAGSGASSPEAHKYVVPWAVNANTKPTDSVSLVPAHRPPAMHDHKLPGLAPLERPRPQLEVAAAPHEDMEMHNASNRHQDHMTVSMLRVEQQHVWFALIGAAVVLFKFINDRATSPRHCISFLWPACIVVLGMLLVFYIE